MQIRIDRDNDKPLFLQIVEEVERLVTQGHIPDGHRMPPTRELARQLGVNRNTVVAAYHELDERGRTTAHTGRGTFVRTDTLSDHAGIRWEETLGHAAQRRALHATLDLHSVPVQEADISFAMNFPAEDLLPVKTFHGALDRVLESEGARILTYGSPAGYGPLRHWIAETMSTAGVPVTAEEIVITTGSQQGIDLMARALVNPGDTVLMAEPGYPGALSAFQVYGAQVVGLESDGEGIRIDALESALARTPAKLLYVVPNFHNPTGVTMSESRRVDILDLAARHRLPVLEDDSCVDLRFEGEPLPSLHTLDRNELTTYVSSFSKKLLPGLRVGWLTGPSAVRQRLVALKQVADCSTSLLLQAALHEFCSQGLLEEHLQKVRAQYRERRDVMVSAMRRHFPEGVHWTEPQGGLVLWVTLPQHMDARELLLEARGKGVSFNAGELFYATQPRRHQMRLTFGATPPQGIRRGIKILGEILSRKAARETARETDQEAVPLV